MVDGSKALAITRDVAEDIKPDDSRRVQYDDEALDFYANVLAEYRAKQQDDPNIMIDIRE